MVRPHSASRPHIITYKRTSAYIYSIFNPLKLVQGCQTSSGSDGECVMPPPQVKYLRYLSRGIIHWTTLNVQHPGVMALMVTSWCYSSSTRLNRGEGGAVHVSISCEFSPRKDLSGFPLALVLLRDWVSFNRCFPFESFSFESFLPQSIQINSHQQF